MTARRSNTANVFETTLSVAMAPTDLTATVVATTGGPATPGFLVIEPDKPTTQLEIIYFDGTFTGTTFVTSGIGNRYLTGSAAASGLTHPIGSKVRFSPVAQLFTDLFDYIDSVKTVLTAAGDLPYATAASTWARLAKGTAYQALTMNAGATAPAWAASLQSLLTAAGDIIIATGANAPSRLAKGTDGQVLTLASGLPSWAAVPSSPFALIADVLLGADTSALGTFTNLLSITCVGAGTFVLFGSALAYNAAGSVEFVTVALCPNIGNFTSAYKAAEQTVGTAIAGAEAGGTIYVRHTITQAGTTTYYLNAKSGGVNAIIKKLDNNSVAVGTYLAAQQIA